jgi:hypothetical protein
VSAINAEKQAHTICMLIERKTIKYKENTAIKINQTSKLEGISFLMKTSMIPTTCSVYTGEEVEIFGQIHFNVK